MVFGSRTLETLIKHQPVGGETLIPITMTGGVL